MFHFVQFIENQCGLLTLSAACQRPHEPNGNSSAICLDSTTNRQICVSACSLSLLTLNTHTVGGSVRLSLWWSFVKTKRHGHTNKMAPPPALPTACKELMNETGRCTSRCVQSASSFACPISYYHTVGPDQ